MDQTSHSEDDLIPCSYPACKNHVQYIPEMAKKNRWCPRHKKWAKAASQARYRERNLDKCRAAVRRCQGRNGSSPK